MADGTVVARLTEDIMAALPGLTPELVGQQIALCARRALAATRIWREDLLLTLAAGTADYALDATAFDAAICGAYAATLVASGKTLRPASVGSLPRPVAAGEPREFWLRNAQTLVVFPTPAAGERYDLKLTVALRPLDGLAELPDAVLLAMEDALGEGVRTALYLMPGKPWTSLKNAMLHSQRFSGALARLRQEQARGGIADIAAPTARFPGGWP